MTPLEAFFVPGVGGIFGFGVEWERPGGAAGPCLVLVGAGLGYLSSASWALSSGSGTKITPAAL